MMLLRRFAVSIRTFPRVRVPLYGAYSTSKDLEDLCGILGIKFMPYNEQLNIQGDIRVIDGDGKNLGVFTLQKAINEAKQNGLDLVLVNNKVTPAICRAINYEEFLHQKFITDILEKDPNQQKKEKQGQTKQIQISAKISMQDLKNKAQQAIELSKRAGKIRVVLYANKNNIDQSKNILYTLQDLVNQQLTAQEGIIEKKVKKEEVSSYELKEAGTEEIETMLEIEFNVIDFSTVKRVSQDYTTQEIKQLIGKYLQRKRRPAKEHEEVMENFSTDSKYSNILKDVKAEAGVPQNDEQLDLEVNWQEEYKKTSNLSPQEQKKRDEDFQRTFLEYVKENETSVEALRNQLEELKKKQGLQNSQDALMHFRIQQLDKKIKTISRLERIYTKIGYRA